MHDLSRREMLLQAGAGFGSLPLAWLLARDSSADSLDRPGPLAPRIVHRPAQARNVIFLFMEGGPSHIDLFDPKPRLQDLAGKPLPDSFAKVITAMGEINSPLLASKRRWKQHGESGTWVSDWLPYTAAKVDDLAVIRSCWTNGLSLIHI